VTDRAACHHALNAPASKNAQRTRDGDAITEIEQLKLSGVAAEF
jgi:hypothetical protein